MKRIKAGFAQTVGLPNCLSECGITRGILSVLAAKAAQQWTGCYNPRPVGETELLQLYDIVGIFVDLPLAQWETIPSATLRDPQSAASTYSPPARPKRQGRGLTL